MIAQLVDLFLCLRAKIQKIVESVID